MAALAPVMWLGACSFDDGRLSDLARCETNLDCPDGFCFDGYCFEDLSRAVDAGAPDGVGPIHVRDFGGDSEDGGPLDAETDGASDEPGPADRDASDDEGGDPDLADGVDGPSCSNPNPCGGCAPLIADPGDPCEAERCGAYVCDQPDRLRCVEGILNACGGCSELSGSRGDPCGGCGGELVCADGETLVCQGEVLNVCGGCGGPSGEEGDACGCLDIALAETHVLACAGEQLACADDNGADSTATPLPDSSDEQSSWAAVRGALISGEEADWFSVLVVDIASQDAMFPDLRLTGLSRDHDLCAYLVYATGAIADVRCASGAESRLGEIEGCCSASEGAANELVELRNAAWWTDRFDTESGGGNDNAIIYIEVVGEAIEGCEPYTLEYRF